MKFPKYFEFEPDVRKDMRFDPKDFNLSPHKNYEKANRILVNEHDFLFFINNYYSNKILKMHANIIFPVPRELLRNAFIHGDGKLNGVNLSIFLSLEKIVVGCCDGGEYFRDSEIKRKWESGTPVYPSKAKLDEKGEEISGGNYLNRLTNDYGDVYVDTSSATIYVGIHPLMKKLTK